MRRKYEHTTKLILFLINLKTVHMTPTNLFRLGFSYDIDIERMSDRMLNMEIDFRCTTEGTVIAQATFDNDITIPRRYKIEDIVSYLKSIASNNQKIFINLFNHHLLTQQLNLISVKLIDFSSVINEDAITKILEEEE